jgi:hypothetical protein
LLSHAPCTAYDEATLEFLGVERCVLIEGDVLTFAGAEEIARVYSEGVTADGGGGGGAGVDVSLAGGISPHVAIMSLAYLRVLNDWSLVFFTGGNGCPYSMVGLFKLTHNLKAPGFNPWTLNVISRFQSNFALLNSTCTATARGSTCVSTSKLRARSSSGGAVQAERY